MYKNRVLKLRERLIQEDVEAILISNFYNILYLTGFKTLTTDEREAFLLVTQNKVYLFSDARYIDKDSIFSQELETRLIEADKGLIQHLKEIIRSEGIKRLGFEAEDVSYFEFARLKTGINDVTLQPTQKLLIKHREIKDDEEIAKIGRACEIGDACLTAVSKTFKIGLSEKEIAFRIEFWLKEKGFDLAFYPIVAVDANSALPHYDTRAGEGRTHPGSILLIDFGVKFEDYLSDITRIFFLGKPNDSVAKVYADLLAAQEKTLRRVEKIKKLADLDRFCREEIEKSGLSNYSHSTGHGVGLEIHEYPKVSFNSLDQKLEKQIITIEPGTYFPGKFGFRIEDTIVVENGGAKILTNFPKQINIVS